MTLFFADVRIFVSPKHEAETISIEVPAPDINTAVAMLMAWKAGLAVHPRFDTAMEESLSAKPTRSREYRTMREASLFIRNRFFL